MKKFSFLAVVLFFAFASCKKSSTFDAAAQAATDDAAIQAYLKTNNITAIKDPTGFYYKIVTQGTGTSPISTSTITVNYSGKLLDGTVFDTGTASPLLLSSTVVGWQTGLPYLKTGGRIMLFIPSALGYGNAVSGSIPANSVLIFTIDLLSVK